VSEYRRKFERIFMNDGTTLVMSSVGRMDSWLDGFVDIESDGSSTRFRIPQTSIRLAHEFEVPDHVKTWECEDDRSMMRPRKHYKTPGPRSEQ
jgi:hypothetical protein